MRRSLTHRFFALLAASVLCLSPAGQAIAHAGAHVHLAEHGSDHHPAHATVEAIEHGSHQTHVDQSGHHPLQVESGLFAADHPGHSHVVIDGATVKRDSTSLEWSIAALVVVPVVLSTQSQIEPSVSAIDIALLPRPGPEPGRQRGPRPPPLC